ncbi:hypothetical protein EVG20_g2809 [Dentipellis fragilis]|uniref:Amine oxidase domain-containing protein n=1 Tax=Dentipellis fragilis TaxID=205917 RepID=A0A4Y9Z825_9AGAM|nr:hypothetical protein EVG20_g2809 [Dentipellis fragilis]
MFNYLLFRNHNASTSAFTILVSGGYHKPAPAMKQAFLYPGLVEQCFKSYFNYSEVLAAGDRWVAPVGQVGCMQIPSSYKRQRPICLPHSDPPSSIMPELPNLPVFSKSLRGHHASIHDLAANHLVDCIIDAHSTEGTPRTGPASFGSQPVGIIGAGTAGLYAAMILQDLGVPYQILEANDRIGGRIFTRRFNGSAGYDAPKGTPARYDYFDVGAMRYPRIPFMDRVFDLFERVGISDLLVPYYLGAENNLILFQVSVSNGGAVPDVYALSGPDHWIDKTFEPFKRLFGEVYDSESPVEDRVRRFRIAWDTLTRQDHHSTRGYMQSGKDGKPDDALPPFPEPVVHWLETFEAGTGNFNLAFVESVLDSLDFDWPLPATCPGPTEYPWVCIDGGSDHMVNEMAKVLHSQPVLAQRVTKIALLHGDGDQVEVTSTSGGRTSTRHYSHVISTLPLSCLGAIHTDGLGLLYNQKQAIRALNYDSSTKVGIKFKNRWWEKEGVVLTGPIRGGQSSSDTQIRTCVYPSYGRAADRWPCAGEKRQGGSDAPRAGLGRAREDARHPEREIRAVEDHFAYNWDMDEYARGAFALYGPGQFGAPGDAGKLFASIKAPAAGGKFVIAGEATSAHHGWVLGALNSAWRAVYYVLLDKYQDNDLLKRFTDRWGIPDEESTVNLPKLAALALDRVL